MASLLERFYDPTSGVIMLDGLDIRTLDLSWLRGQVIGFINQVLANLESFIKLLTQSIPSCLISTASSSLYLCRSQFCLDHLSWRTSALGNLRPQMLRSLMQLHRPMLTASLQVSQMAITQWLVCALICHFQKD